LPQDGILQQEPTDEGTGASRTVEPPTENEATQPLTEPVPTCPEGQVLDEETNLCVLEEQEATEEPTTEEDQPPKNLIQNKTTIITRLLLILFYFWETRLLVCRTVKRKC
jgi:hypothetical protein